jgi:hypothetical protein
VLTNRGQAYLKAGERADALANRAVAHLFLGSQTNFDQDVAKAKALGASDKTVQYLKAYAVYYDKKKKREDKK